MREAFLLAALTGLLLPAGGCGPSTEPTYPVSGKVFFDAQPLPEGDILFVPVSGSYGPEPGKIQQGRFEFRARAGRKRVEIRASRIIPGGAKGAMGEPVAEDYLPECYNNETTLTREVTADGENQFEFKLHSNEN